MTTRHAAIWLDHQHARVFQFDLARIDAAALSHPGATGACTGLLSPPEGRIVEDPRAAILRLRRVLVTGPRDVIEEFERHTTAYSPEVAECIVGYQVVDEPSVRKLLALVLWYFTPPKAPRRCGRPRAVPAADAIDIDIAAADA